MTPVPLSRAVAGAGPRDETMTGMDRRTGRSLGGWDHVVQSLEVIFSTRIGERVMRRSFGSDVPALLGEPLSEPTALRFFTAIIVAIELWEPRYRVRQVAIEPAQNSPEALRAGRLRLAIIGEYRPRGHLGDPTPEARDRVVHVSAAGGAIEVAA